MTALCRLYGVTRAGFYAWRARPVSAHLEQDRRLETAITTLFTAHCGRYGSPRIHDALVKAGWVVSRRRVARLMHAAGLRAKAVRGYRAKTGVHRFFAQQPNLLRGRTTTGVNQIWVGDITYLAIGGHWFYLAVIMDYHSRRVLAWSLGRRRDTRVTRALFQAAARRRQPVPGWLFHSDRGSLLLRDLQRNRTQTQPKQGPIQKHSTCTTVSVFKRMDVDDLGVQAHGQINGLGFVVFRVRPLSQPLHCLCARTADVSYQRWNLISVRGPIWSEGQSFAPEIRSAQAPSMAPHSCKEPGVKRAEELNAQHLTRERALLYASRKAFELTREPLFFGFGIVVVYGVVRCVLSAPLA